jgi:hypothetical protein
MRGKIKEIGHNLSFQGIDEQVHASVIVVSPYVMQALENSIRCLFVPIVLFPENLGKFSLNFGSG